MRPHWTESADQSAAPTKEAMTDTEQEPESTRRTRLRAARTDQWMQSQEIPDHWRQQIEDLSEFIESPSAAQAMSATDHDDEIDDDRDRRIERRRRRRAERIAAAYQVQYGITPSVWISLSVWVLRVLVAWLRER